MCGALVSTIKDSRWRFGHSLLELADRWAASARPSSPGFRTVHDAVTEIAGFPVCRLACRALRLLHRRTGRDHGGPFTAGDIHPWQRATGRGDSGSPHPGRHADDLV